MTESRQDAQHHAPIAEAMRAYSEGGALAFHTPGHKQGLGAHALLRSLVTDEGPPRPSASRPSSMVQTKPI